jgi:SAM-dependent methyltransferase
MTPEELFYRVFESMPRQGPGCRTATEKAFFSLRSRLPERPRVLDIGCGSGTQTLDLARLSDGPVTAVDTHQPFLDTLLARAAAQGRSPSITAVNASMDALPFGDREFDLIWSEGSIFIMGLANGLSAWKRLLAKGGTLVVSDATWFRPDPPEEIRAFWEKEGGGITTEAEKEAEFRKAGYFLLSEFRLPDAGWQEEYYDPMMRVVAECRKEYGDDAGLSGLLDSLETEAAMYRKYSPYYGYTFFIAGVE